MTKIFSQDAWLGQRIGSCMARLADSIWIFFLSLGLQMLINTYFIYACYANLPEGETMIVGVGIWSSLLTALLRSSVWSSIFWWGLAIFKRSTWGRSVYITLIAFLSTGAFLVEAYLLGRYQTVFTLSIAQIMAGTNPQEVKEYFEMVVNVPTILSAVLGVALLFLGYRYLSRRSVALTPVVRLGVALCWLFSLGVSLLNVGYFLPRTYERVATIGQAHNLTLAPYDRLIWSTYSFILESEAIARLASDIQNIDLGTMSYAPYTALPAPKDLNVVIIVGETLRRDYMHCYGYPLPNTPKLDSLIATGDMVAYTDAVSPSWHTIATLTSAFTYHTNNAPPEKKWYDYPSLQTTLQRAGYSVYWLSNQEGSGLAVQHINTLANLSDKCHYVNNRSYGGNTGQDLSSPDYDEDVLPMLETLSIRREEKRREEKRREEKRREERG